MRILRTFLYELKYAFIGINRHLMLCISSMSAIAVTLLLIGLVGILSVHVNYFSTDIKQDLTIHVILKENVTSQEDIDSVKKEIKAINNVAKVELSTKENELEMMIKEKGEAFKEYRGKNNPLSNAFFVHVKDASKIDKTSKQIRHLQNVSSTAFGGDSVTRLVEMLSLIQKIGLGIVILLVLLSLYLIYNTIKTTIDSRSDEIIIMRTVGATNGFIGKPFIVQGIIIGLVGSCIPYVLLCIGYRKVYDLVQGKLFTPMFSLFKPSTVNFELGILLIVIGILIGGFASWLATRKYIKMRR